MPMHKNGGAVGRFARGGKVKRADGGEILEKRQRGPGELDEGEQRDYLKSKAKDATKNNDVKTAGGVGLVGTGLGTTLAHMGSRFGRPGRIGGMIATGLGLGALSSAGKGEIEKKKLNAEAAEFDKADSAERKSGGRITNLGKYAHGGKITTKGDEAGKIAKKETDGEEEYACGGRIGRKEGGPAIGLHEDGKTVGSGGGLGRLAKAKMYGK